MVLQKEKRLTRLKSFVYVPDLKHTSKPSSLLVIKVNVAANKRLRHKRLPLDAAFLEILVSRYDPPAGSLHGTKVGSADK